MPYRHGQFLGSFARITSFGSVAAARLCAAMVLVSGGLSWGQQPADPGRPETGIFPDGTKWIRIEGVRGTNQPVTFVPDEFIVVFKPEAADRIRLSRDQGHRITSGLRGIDDVIAAAAVADLDRQFPTAVRPPVGSPFSDLTGYYKVKIEAGADLDAAIAAFALDPAVDHVERIGIHPVHGCAEGAGSPVSDTYYRNPPPTFDHPQWDLWDTRGIDAEKAWVFETGDPSVVVVAMDTGLRYVHADLGGSNPPGPSDSSTNGNVWVNPMEIPNNGVDDDHNGRVDDIVGYDFVTGNIDSCAPGEDCVAADNDPRDFNGHGTHTAGTMAAITNNGRGVAGIAGGFGDGTPASEGNGVKVMGLRIGWEDAIGRGFVRMDFAAEAMNYVAEMKARGVNIAAVNCSWSSGNSGGLDAAVNNVMAADVLIVHSAGNSNSNEPDYLGGKNGVMNVAATARNGARAAFSNYGSWVDIAAPGVDIISTAHNQQDPGTDYVATSNGTSMAAPHVAGVAALLESCKPSLTAAEKFDILVRSTCPAGSTGIGGILNAALALDEAGCTNRPMGACCDAQVPHVCTQRTANQCGARQGAYGGDETSCEDLDCNRCEDPICEFCWVDTAAENQCAAGLNGNGACDCGCQFDDDDCLALRPGACCSAEAPYLCTDDMLRAQCLGGGGAFRGDDTICAETDCSRCDLLNCDRCWIGTLREGECETSRNGDGFCDCGCQFVDRDCFCGDGHCLFGEDACTCPEDCLAQCGDACCSHQEKRRSCTSDCMDIWDFGRLARCFTGPDIPRSFPCRDSDYEDDGDIDIEDYKQFRATRFGGP